MSNNSNKGCDYCLEPNGDNSYPHYGIAPHNYIIDVKKPSILIVAVNHKKTWPDNFKEDPEASGMGTYLYCPECGASAEYVSEFIEDDEKENR